MGVETERRVGFDGPFLAWPTIHVLLYLNTPNQIGLIGPNIPRVG